MNRDEEMLLKVGLVLAVVYVLAVLALIGSAIYVLLDVVA